jgi:hypothetical protein
MLWKEHLEEQSRHQMQYEVGGGSAGFLSVIDPGQPEVTRLGGGHYSACRPAWRLGCQSQVYGSVWDARALTEVARRVRKANTIWFVDNIAVRFLWRLWKGWVVHNLWTRWLSWCIQHVCPPFSTLIYRCMNLLLIGSKDKQGGDSR